MRTWAVLAGFALTTTASAQPEQWLQYHSSPEGKGYNWLDLSTNPPPNLALPKLNAPPYCARWTTPLDPTGGRWLCFDRTHKAGPYDRVYLDRNGNGRLDDDPPEDAVRRDEYCAYFDPLRCVLQGEDGPIAYHLGLQFMKYSDTDVNALVQSAGWYEGVVDLAGKKRRIQLIDGNVNAVFDDRTSDPTEGDRIHIEDDKAGDRYLGRLFEVDGQFFQIQIARDGAFVTVRKAENVALGKVKLSGTISELVVVGEPGHFVRQPTNGEFTLPVGKYRVQRWAIDRKDTKGVAWQLSGSTYGDGLEFEVAAARPGPLDIGEPVYAAFQASESKSGVSFSLRLQGRQGESVELMRGAQQARAPQLILASQDATYRATNNFQYG